MTHSLQGPATHGDREAAVLSAVRALADGIGPRQAGSKGEIRAAEWLAEELTEAGYAVTTDRFPAVGTFITVYAPLTALGVASFVVAWWWPWVGVAGGLLSASLLTVENLPFQVFARLVKFRRSLNVEALREPTEQSEQDIVVMAHIDSAIASDVRNMKLVRLLFIAIVVSCLGIAGLSLTAALGTGRSVLIVGVPFAAHLAICTGLMLHQALRSPVVAGAGDNASGVAAMLQAARELPRLRRSTVWFVGTGAEESGLMGAIRMLQRHRFSRERSWFINVDTVSAGHLRTARVEGMLLPLHADALLCEVAAEEGEAEGFEVGSEALQAMSSDGCVPLAQGYRAVSVGASDSRWHQVEDVTEGVSPEVVARAAVLIRRMVERLDTT